MPEPEQQPSTEVAEHTGAGPLAQAEALYSQQERKAIAQFLNIDAADTALVPFLALAAQLDLSPIHGEIWLIKGRRKDTESGQWVDFYRPTIGRDGLLKHARTKHADVFGGLQFGVVCANDTFEVESDGWDTKVLHRMASLSVDGEHESRWRGKVLGAWAKLYFKDGRPPLYYFAPAHEHVRVEEKAEDGGEKKRVLAGAWSYTSTMIIKSAVSYVLRIGFGVTGVVPFDELRVDDPQMAGGASDDTFAAAAGDSGGGALDEDPNPKNAEFIAELDLPEDLRGELTIALEQVNGIAPFSWTPAKVRMRLGSDCDEEKARKVLGEVEGEYRALREHEAERLKREADQAREQEAIQIALARDVEPPIELHVVPGESKSPEAEVEAWVLVKDVLFDEPAGVMVFKLDDDRELNYSPTAEVEVRTPAEG